MIFFAHTIKLCNLKHLGVLSCGNAYTIHMNIISWNVNGLRAVAKRDFINWVQKQSPDILCLQEIKINDHTLPANLRNHMGYHSFFNFAAKSGYSGVAVFTKARPKKIRQNVLSSNRFNQEGRTLLLEYENFSLLNIYIPHGGRDKLNLDYKLDIYRQLFKLLQSQKKPLFLAGDFNIAHNDIDLARPKQNRNNIMFTAEERQQITNLLNQDYIDCFRHINSEPGNYTWWPYMANARERNIGWRIDYIFIPQTLQDKIIESKILKDVMGSDHCPIAMKIQLAF
jgi:exodeoxyribonuclease III